MNIGRQHPGRRSGGGVRGPVLGRVGWRRWHAVGLTALTAYSAALGWQAQLVSYPLFAAVGPEDLASYHSRYNAAIPIVVIWPGFLTFLAGTAFYWTRPLDVPRQVAALVGAAGVTSLLSTVLWAIPMHDRLDQAGQSIDTIDSLLQANLLRSLALTVGALTLTWCVATSGQGSGPRRLTRSTSQEVGTASSG